MSGGRHSISTLSSLTSNHSPDRMHANPASANDGSSSPDIQNEAVDTTPKQSRLGDLKRKTKARTKKLLKREDVGVADSTPVQDGEIRVQSIEEDPAFNPSKLVRQGRSGPGTLMEKTKGSLHAAAYAIAHPRQNAKSQATKTTAGQLSKAEHPYLTQKADLDFLRAHTELDEAELSPCATWEEREDRVEGKRKLVDELEDRRQSLQVAWTTRRHVQRVRVVPKRHLEYPRRQAFVERDATGAYVRFQWENWIGHILLWYTQDFSTQYVDDFDQLPFDLNALKHHAERLILATAPWQSWAMSVRRVYRWENPAETGRWLALYLVLWYTSHVAAFGYGYVCYMVLRNYYYPSSVQSLRESIERAKNSETTALRFGELVDKHGKDDWLGPVIEHLGPYIQVQLGDLANILEAMSNFYRWRSPRKTAASLTFLVACFLVTAIADMEFCMKILYFIIGGAFFLCWPIASRYPKYRHLVSPIKWVLWDIPTNAEWSFQYLRRKAQVRRERMIEETVDEEFTAETTRARQELTREKVDEPRIATDEAEESLGEAWDDSDDDSDDEWHSVSSSHSVLDSRDILSLRCQFENHLGRLIIYSTGIRFIQSLPRKQLWDRSFLELAEMRKLPGSQLPKVAMIHRLELTFTDGESVLLGFVKDRDEAFNTIIGFSSIQWQALQDGVGRAKDDTEDGKSRCIEKQSITRLIS
ncbi:MAG: hypothetical protein M1817_000583 [Caeruleum heppii]|nr:MAG: hypothetical protein M1817_000583 [Caeruleum heppii]